MRFVYASGSRPLEGYTIKRGIGIGGFGEVYFATSDAGKEVALKRIQRNLDVELRGVSQCLNLKHINLITLWDIKYDDRGEGWVVMEYVAGESLKDVVDRNPNGMPIEEVHAWFHGIAGGVSYLHNHGIVHRDLKPGNIFLDEDIVKIGDYGLSKFISCSRRSGQTESVGTFHYMAPEIGKGVYGKEIDIYAMGIILFEMLTGRVPFDGESSQEIMMKHLTADPDVSEIPGPYRSVIRQALAKDPDLRYSDVSEMLQTLPMDAVPALQPAEAPPPSPAADDPLVIDSESKQRSETLFIRDEDEDIVLGEVKEVTAAEVVSSTGPPQMVQMTNQEPIAQAVKGGWDQLVDWWNNAQLSTPVKVVLLVVAALLLIMNGHWLVPLLVVLGFVYLVYFAVRSLVLACTTPPSSSPPPTTTGRRQLVRRQQHRLRNTKEILRDALKARSQTERLMELTGSLLLSAVVCGVLCLLMMALGSQEFDGSIHTWSFFAWLTLTSAAGAWMILVVSKFWEGSQGDQVQRRFFMLIAGLVLGAVAFGVTDLLLIRESAELKANEVSSAIAGSRLPSSMRSAEGALKLPVYLIYFAGLFVILRWWRQADPLRKTRLSVWATGMCVIWALILPFPQPWGLMLAATMSIAVQLSAPWMNPKERAQIRGQF